MLSHGNVLSHEKNKSIRWIGLFVGLLSDEKPARFVFRLHAVLIKNQIGKKLVPSFRFGLQPRRPHNKTKLVR
jgi:hypothetical protein